MRVNVPPTFSVSRDMVQGIIVGGYKALRMSVEGAEDNPEDGKRDCVRKGINKNDVVIGIATGETTPYVHGALEYAKSIGCKTIFLTSTLSRDIEINADIVIEVLTGPEIIAGSTRLKAGTAIKMVLNMISTATKIKLGKVYGNLMVGLKAVNENLIDRGCRIISKAIGLSYEESKKYLFKVNKNVKVALVMIKRGITKRQAIKLLDKYNGFVRFILDNNEGEVL